MAYTGKRPGNVNTDFLEAGGELANHDEVTVDSNGDRVILPGATTESKRLEIGLGRTGNGFSYIDLIGDATYTDYGCRLIRGNTGADADSTLLHRGTGNLNINTNENAAITFTPNNSERVKIDSDGLKFNGDTAAANALDDYEEGTWTPTTSDLIGFSGSPTVSFATYTKIGKNVTVQASINFASASGNLAVGDKFIMDGLPFTMEKHIGSVASYNYNDANGGIVEMTGGSNGSTIIRFKVNSVRATPTRNGGGTVFSFSYQTTA